MTEVSYINVVDPLDGPDPGQGTALEYINNYGVAVGAIFDDYISTQYFVYSGGGFEKLDDNVWFVSGINDSGQIAGTERNAQNTDFGFVYHGSTYELISDPAADLTGTQATGINDAGVVVGDYFEGYGGNEAQGSLGFIFQNGSYTTVSDPLASPIGTFISAINNPGEIAGYYIDSNVHFHGFLYDDGVYTPIEMPGEGVISTIPLAINNVGTVAGFYKIASGINEGFLYKDGIYTNVSDPNGVDGTEIQSINDAGEAVGVYFDAQGQHHGFEYSNGVYTTIDPPQAAEVYVGEINNAGEIVGDYQDSSNVFHGFIAEAPCYCTGSRLLTEHGYVAVERLEAGVRLVTAAGGARPIRWIGRRAIDCRRHRAPREVWPVRVAAGAFGGHRPARDLWLSPGHSVAIGGALIQIRSLLNGRSIAQVETRTVEYWHVELDAHDIILAEGLPAESYLDCGNRGAFANGGAFIEAHPNFEPKHFRETCLPIVLDGPEIVAAKTRLLARLAEQGCKTTHDAGAHILAEGRRIEPNWLAGQQFAFALPAGCASVILESRTFIPAHARPESDDHRELGLCVARLRAGGREIALEDEALPAAGWHPAEFSGGRFTLRRTRGAARVPTAGARSLIVDLAGPGHYWRPDGEFSAGAHA